MEVETLRQKRMTNDPPSRITVGRRLALNVMLLVALIFLAAAETHAGFLYVLRAASGGNQIHGFSVNETTGALTALAGFPILSGGSFDGLSTVTGENLAIDRANMRLFALNSGSDTVSVFSIDPVTGGLTHLPYSPLSIGSGDWKTLAIHPAGSPLIVTKAPAQVASFNITPTTATQAAGSPYFATDPSTSAFSRDGQFLYVAGVNVFISALSVNTENGVLSPLSPTFTNSGNVNRGFTTDVQGRLIGLSGSGGSHLRAFTSDEGSLTAVTGNPFPSGLSGGFSGALSPSGFHYYAADPTGNAVGAFAVAGEGAETTISPVAGSPFATGGTGTRLIALNGAGTFLYAANTTSRNISTFAVDPSGVLTFSSVQAANTLGTQGQLHGIGYMPTVFTVTNLNDAGAGSLRQAVLDANAIDSGVINFSSFFDTARTIQLTTGQLVISSNVIIKRNRAGSLTLQNTAAQGTASRVISTTGRANVEITGVRMTGGNVTNQGGAINLSLGSLILRRVEITGNNALQDGGAIRTLGELILVESVVSGNTSAESGGGIYSPGSGSVRIVDSAIVNNNAVASSFGGAGGIDNTLGTLTISNSTISGNTVTNPAQNGGGIRTGGPTTITNSTIVNNNAAGSVVAGGILERDSDTSAKIRNTIIALNRSTSLPSDVDGDFESGGYNLIGFKGSAIGFDQATDQVGTSSSTPLNPRIAPLDSLGRLVPVHALLPSSPAVDKGSRFGIGHDQHSRSRGVDIASIANAGDGSDIGAVETPRFLVTNTADTGAGSLRGAVNEAVAVRLGIIEFSPHFLTPRTIDLTSTSLLLIGVQGILGPGADLLTVRSVAQGQRIFRTIGSTELSGMTITGGSSIQDAGGGIASSGELSVSDCAVVGNSGGSVGGIVSSGTLTLLNSTVSGNSANAGGPGSGGISADDLTLINSTVSGNTKSGGDGNAGGVRTTGFATIAHSTITNNLAAGAGSAGGVFQAAGIIVIGNSIVAANQNNSSVPDVAGTFISSGYNLIGNVGAAAGFNQAGDQKGTGVSPLNPLLEPLANNGGPTFTHALLTGSPAIDKGKAFGYAIDQRRSSRPVDLPPVTNAPGGDGSDIGSFEFARRLKAPFDFDNDGRTDVSVYRPSDGNWHINASTIGYFNVVWGGVGDRVVTGDYDGDGTLDIAVYRPSTGEWFVRSSDDGGILLQVVWGSGSDIPTPGQYDGDGRMDVAVFRPATGEWFIRNSSGGFQTRVWGVNGDRPITADYDGDGVTDIAVFRPSTGEWFVNGSTAGFFAVTWGVGADRLVPADYDGDGKEDIAVWRPSDGMWHILRSSDGGYTGILWGANGDVPAPGDYDGDGRVDTAAIRNGTWHLNRTTSGYMAIDWGVGTDVALPGRYAP